MWIESRDWKSLRKPSEDYAPFISVIIPAYNERDAIDSKLRDLLKQDYPNMEIIVVDDGSADETSEIVKNFVKENSSQLKVQLFAFPERRGKASAINYAWQHCNGEIVIISDADTLLGEGAIQKIVQNFSDQKVGAVTGKLSMINYGETSATKLEKAYRSIFDVLRIGESHIDSTPIFNGPLVALRRNLFDHLEPNTLADDTEISLKVIEKGYRAIFDPEAMVYAFTPKNFKFRMKQKIRRAQGIIQSFIRHRNMLFKSEYGRYGLVIFPAEFFMHIISPFLLVANAILFSFLIFNSILTIHFIAIFILVIAILGLILVAVGHMSKDFIPIRLIRLFLTFIEHQIFLMLGLLSIFVGRYSAKWEKIK
jgi:cellulose synthase/poly-beta-1,6-N-acetylglucosamine synthase-like glycosyltransferase